jgi:hypothetical protein
MLAMLADEVGVFGPCYSISVPPEPLEISTKNEVLSPGCTGTVISGSSLCCPGPPVYDPWLERLQFVSFVCVFEGHV